MLSYSVWNRQTGQKQTITPVYYEDCMNPGKVRAIPVRKTRSRDALTLQSGDSSVTIPFSDLKNGKIEIAEQEFTPILPKQAPRSCNPCTNCGRCSW